MYFALTLATMLHAGMMHGAFFTAAVTHLHPPLWTWASVGLGAWYALPLAAILWAHELGHMRSAKRDYVTLTGPYFFPIGLAMTGTFGAMLRRKCEFPTRASMLRIAAAGPLAGMALIVPVAILGTLWSQPVPMTNDVSFAAFGEPTVLKLIRWGIMGGVPVILWLHPLALAAWVGAIMTWMNLIPYGNFDGGLIVAAAWGPHVAKCVSLIVFALVVVGAVQSYTFRAVLLAMILSGWESPLPIVSTPVRHPWRWTIGMGLVWASVWTVIH